jgi:hypothetical protein
MGVRKTQQPRSVFSRFVRAAEHFSSRPALEVGDQTISYERLLGLVCNVARTIKECESASSSAQSLHFSLENI